MIEESRWQTGEVEGKNRQARGAPVCVAGTSRVLHSWCAVQPKAAQEQESARLGSAKSAVALNLIPACLPFMKFPQLSYLSIIFMLLPQVLDCQARFL